MTPVRVSCPLGPECQHCKEEKRQRYVDLDKLVEAVGDVLWTYEELKGAGRDRDEIAHLQAQFDKDMDTLSKRHAHVA